jgi:uncharacterized membrane protein YkvA (DUF1232 family)
MAKLSHDKAWRKFKDIKGVKKLIESALVLYALVLDGDTPLWVKTLAISALIYLIAPVDAVPDFIPVSGLADDLGVLIAALASLQSQVKPQHRKQAQNLFNQL